MADQNNDLRKRVEDLGPAERLIAALLTDSDHMVHNRPGIVVPAPGSSTGVKWEPASFKAEGPEGGAKEKVAYFCRKVGNKTTKVRAGVIGADNKVREGGRVVGEYRQPGFFPEVAAWVYTQIAEIFKRDNEFVARWASYAFGEEHRDLKVALCAFMLVQNRRGDPVREGGEVLFYDDDYRDVGEAMCLIQRADGKDFNPKLLLRVGDLLRLPVIAQINRDLGFTTSAKNPTMGRWEKAVEKYLRRRELNPKHLEGLVKAGLRTTVIALAQRVHYKPTSPRFYQILRWKQEQAKDGRRSIAIGADVAAAESWEGLSEKEVCERILATKPNYKRLVGLLPTNVGVTRAVMAAAVQAGSLSNQDLIILTPTLEELGLTGVEPVKSRWEAAIKTAENQRAANIAARVKSTVVKEKLEEATANAMKKAVDEVVRGLMVYVFVDVSGSMTAAIEQAKVYLAKLLGGFPLEKVRVATFNTEGTERTIKHASQKGVENAFAGIRAAGGTDYGAGVKALQKYKPGADEDALFIFVGDEEAGHFAPAVRASGLNPVAFGFLKVGGSPGYNAVTGTAAELGIPCFPIDTRIFDDVYAVTRTLRNLIAATPVGKTFNAAPAAPRVSLVEKILKTDLLAKPAWAA
jgi:hypothetical protein